MCLSTVYRNEKTGENIIMKNVTAIECKDGCVLLTDLMDRTVAIEGQLLRANLVDGYVIVREN
jgi:predicted RNA-binding protein